MTFLFPAKNQQGGTTMEGGGRPSVPARVSMFRRLMMVRVTPAERVDGGGGGKETREKDERQPPAPAPAAGAEAEVGSVGLDKMVISFMEESSSSAAAAVERPPRGRCAGNCFNGNTQDGSSDDDDDLDFFLPSASNPPPAAAGDALEILKGLVQCASTAERNLLADAARVAERCRGGRKKAEVRRAVADGLRALGYDAAVCTSRWDKAAGHPAGEHEYIDAVVAVENESVRVVVEVDFRSEFEVARPTKAYRAALQALPPLFVGTPERLGRVVAVVADAARQSLRKRGLHFPPWRKHEYMRAKWLAPHARSGEAPAAATPVSAANFSGEFELRFDEKPKAKPKAEADDDEIPGGEDGDGDEGGDKKITVVVSPAPWRPVEPAAASKLPPDQPPPPPPQAKRKVVTGLASLLLLAT